MAKTSSSDPWVGVKTGLDSIRFLQQNAGLIDTYSIRIHDADKRGTHFDYALGSKYLDDCADFIIPKKTTSEEIERGDNLPASINEKKLVVFMPVHDNKVLLSRMNTKYTIPEGQYGADTWKIIKRGKCTVDAGGKNIIITLLDKDTPHNFVIYPFKSKVGAIIEQKSTLVKTMIIKVAGNVHPKPPEGKKTKTSIVAPVATPPPAPKRTKTRETVQAKEPAAKTTPASKPSKGRKRTPYKVNIERMTVKNDYFRRVLFTGRHSQLVLMSLEPKAKIDREIHDLDQFFRIEDGVVDFSFDELGITFNAKDGDAVIVPAGTYHTVINNSDKPVKLYTLYSPPNHPPGLKQSKKP